jgi:hypothetical protein
MPCTPWRSKNRPARCLLAAPERLLVLKSLNGRRDGGRSGRRRRGAPEQQ